MVENDAPNKKTVWVGYEPSAKGEPQEVFESELKALRWRVADIYSRQIKELELQ